MGSGFGVGSLCRWTAMANGDPDVSDLVEQTTELPEGREAVSIRACISVQQGMLESRAGPMLPSPARRCPVFLLRKHVCFHQAAALAASCSFRLHVVPKTARMSHFSLCKRWRRVCTDAMCGTTTATPSVMAFAIRFAEDSVRKTFLGLHERREASALRPRSFIPPVLL